MAKPVWIMQFGRIRSDKRSLGADCRPLSGQMVFTHRLWERFTVKKRWAKVSLEGNNSGAVGSQWQLAEWVTIQGAQALVSKLWLAAGRLLDASSIQALLSVSAGLHLLGLSWARRQQQEE